MHHPRLSHALVLAVLLVSSFSAKVVAAKTVEAARPNVVFILTDDQHTDSFGFLGGRALTPTIDRLARSGVNFSRGYVSSSVCTPTRFSCLTGRYASRARNVSFKRSTSEEGQTSVQWNTDILHDDWTLPRAMQQAGYVTGAVGKWHNGGGDSQNRVRREVKLGDDPADPRVTAILREGQEKLHAHVRACGFDYAAAINLGNFGNHPCGKMRVHNPEWITQGAVDFIRQNKGRPFFLYMATTLLHGPSPLDSLKADPRITHGGMLDAPLTVQPSREDVLKRTRAAGIHDRLAGATWLDDSVAAVLGELDRHGLAENTLVVFINDHGVDGGKGSLYEGGVRTPIIVRWPGKIDARPCDALVQNIDLAPTILDACDVALPAKVTLDGKSLMPLLTGSVDRIHDSLYCEVGHTRAVVTPEWKYIAFRIPPSQQLTVEQRRRISERYAQMKQGRESKDFEQRPDAPLSHMGFPSGQNTERVGAIKHYADVYYDRDQLFDLRTGAKEEANLAADPAYRSRLKEMKLLLIEHLKGVPGTFGEFKP